MSLLNYSIREEMIKERDENRPTLRAKFKNCIMQDFSTEDINEIRVIDSNNRIIGNFRMIIKSLSVNVSMMILLNKPLSSETTDDKIHWIGNTRQRYGYCNCPIR